MFNYFNIDEYVEVERRINTQYCIVIYYAMVAAKE